MTTENNIPQSDDESENSSSIPEITDTDLEQVSGGLNFTVPGQHFTQKGTPNVSKWPENNFGIKKNTVADESPKETNT